MRFSDLVPFSGNRIYFKTRSPDGFETTREGQRPSKRRLSPALSLRRRLSSSSQSSAPFQSCQLPGVCPLAHPKDPCFSLTSPQPCGSSLNLVGSTVPMQLPVPTPTQRLGHRNGDRRQSEVRTGKQLQGRARGREGRQVSDAHSVPSLWGRWEVPHPQPRFGNPGTYLSGEIS